MRAMRLEDGRERKERGSNVDAGTGGRNKRYGSQAPFPFSVSTEVTCSVDGTQGLTLSPNLQRPGRPLEAFNPGAPVPVPVPVPCPHASPRWPKDFPPMPTPLAKAPRKQHILAPRQTWVFQGEWNKCRPSIQWHVISRTLPGL